jgi:hypothetical protein
VNIVPVSLCVCARALLHTQMRCILSTQKCTHMLDYTCLFTSTEHEFTQAMTYTDAHGNVICTYWEEERLLTIIE